MTERDAQAGGHSRTDEDVEAHKVVKGYTDEDVEAHKVVKGYTDEDVEAHKVRSHEDADESDEDVEAHRKI